MKTYYDPDTCAFTTLDTGFPVDETLANLICASITGGGEVWDENGVLQVSGAMPEAGMRFDRTKREWVRDEALWQQLFADERARKLLQAAQAAQAFIDKTAGIAAVPQFERESWATQALEAQAWAKDNNAPTPILAGIAQSRGVPLDVLRQKALAKSQAFALLTAAVAGQRQAIEDKINAAENMQALDAVVIAYQIPGAS
ncbi:MAG: hypothetical protein Q4A06_00055 [Cardiobacteriaceae bacterium]|nr:hypothetical protein [Cardiobacteriaceae bacterium]